MRQRILVGLVWAVFGSLLMLAGDAICFAQQPQQPPRSLEELTWDVRQLEVARAQCERNVSTLGVQVERLQKELAQLKEAPKEKK